MSSNECEINLLQKRKLNGHLTCDTQYIRNNVGIFIKVLKPNSWLVSFPKPTKVRYICDGKHTQESSVQTSKTMLLSINHDCKFATDTMLVTGNNNVIFPTSKIYEHPPVEFNQGRVLLVPGAIAMVNIQDKAQVINFGESHCC